PTRQPPRTVSLGRSRVAASLPTAKLQFVSGYNSGCDGDLCPALNWQFNLCHAPLNWHINVRLSRAINFREAYNGSIGDRITCSFLARFSLTQEVFFCPACLNS